MPEHEAQYDHIGSKYDDYSRKATIKLAENYTVFRLVGPLEGKRVMDLACGDSFYTRRLKQRGAAEVIGVDISPEMIRLAKQSEHAEPLGISYQVGDAVSLPRLGSFDLVTAIYLLTYALKRGELVGMFRSAYDNLGAGGRFIALTDNPSFSRTKPNCTKYGVTILSLSPAEVGYDTEAEFVADPPFRVTWHQWNEALYEMAIKEAGFRDFAWCPLEVAPEDIARYGEAYWQDYYENCPSIGLICTK